MSDLRNEFSWSKSRDTLFRECLRAYYYNHYGAWGEWESGAPAEVRELYVMKNLNSRATWMGILVHDVAEQALRALQKGRFWPLSSALAEAERRLRAELEISQRAQYRAGARIPWCGRRLKGTGLQEHYYNVQIPDEEWETTIAEVLQCITRLYEAPTFHRLQVVGTEAILTVEELQSFLVGDVKVWVKLDLAVRGREGGVVIVDWKTGGAHRADDIALQLGIYGPYGSQLWEIPPDRIQGYDVNLRDGVTHQHQIDSGVLEEVAGHIQESARQMRELLEDVEQNCAHIDRFPPTGNAGSCRRCRFRRACDRE